ncbi:MAG: hypothetical protein R3F05_17145 [Planctomycetota bacterium]
MRAARPNRNLRLVGALLLCPLAAACGSFAGPTDKGLSFATMQAMNPGVEGEWLLREYPDAREVQRDPRTGRLRRLAYWVNDPAGDNRPLVLWFDENGILTRKDYGGPLLRPPADQPAPEAVR